MTEHNIRAELLTVSAALSVCPVEQETWENLKRKRYANLNERK